MKAIILARVSTEEQKEAGNSLPAQIERLKRYCQSKKLEILQTYSFDESAYKTKRDEFDKILKTLNASKEKIAVCFDKVDRFSRNVFDKRVGILYEMTMNDKIELHFASDNLIITPNISATEKFHFGINLGLAKYYSDAISDSVKRSFEAKIRRGEWTGKAPIGYLNITDEKENKDIVPDPERAHLIIKLFEIFSEGNDSIDTITEKIRKLGLKGTIDGKKIARSCVYKALKDTFYYGLAYSKSRNEFYQHKYKPLISQELYQKVQEVFDKWNKKPFQYASKPYIFRGLIRCSDPKCGCTITPDTSKGHIYYSCTNYRKIHTKRLWVKEEALLEPIYKVLDNLSIPDEKIDYLINELKKTNESKNLFHNEALNRLNNDYNKFQQRIDSLLNLLLDESITKDIYDKKLKDLKEQQQNVIIQIEEHTQADESFYLTASMVFSLAKRARVIFESSEVQEKRTLLNYLLQNCYLNGKNIEFTLRIPFNVIAESSKCPIGLPG